MLTININQLKHIVDKILHIDYIISIICGNAMQF